MVGCNLSMSDNYTITEWAQLRGEQKCCFFFNYLYIHVWGEPYGIPQ